MEQVKVSVGFLMDVNFVDVYLLKEADQISPDELADPLFAVDTSAIASSKVYIPHIRRFLYLQEKKKQRRENRLTSNFRSRLKNRP